MPDDKTMKPRHIWNTHGDWVATLVGIHIWDMTGSWVGWLDGDDVYKVDGEWIGKLSRDMRIVRKRSAPRRPLRNDIPPKPEKPALPARAPLPPSFSELAFSEIDVLEEDPDIFKRLSDMRPDME
jgi:hypothetical protein